MSRAFVRESDFPSLADLPPVVSALPPGAKNYLTSGGAERLRASLARLRDTERPRLVAAPPDDTDAKRELQVLDQRIRYLQESLRTAEIVAPPAGPPEVVRFGTTVTVKENGGTVSRYRIVGVDETGFADHHVSWLSPLARALMNAKRGDVVTFAAPRGPRRLEVIDLAHES